MIGTILITKEKFNLIFKTSNLFLILYRICEAILVYIIKHVKCGCLISKVLDLIYSIFPYYQ